MLSIAVIFIQVSIYSVEHDEQAATQPLILGYTVPTFNF